MNGILTRLSYAETGIFGHISFGDMTFMTCEHAYEMGNSLKMWMPKIPVGTYVCKRGMHRLANMTEDFETFEITNVPGHTNILIHVGNYNKDSEGCVLIGMMLASTNGIPMITESRESFAHFMNIQDGCNEFTLEVKG